MNGHTRIFEIPFSYDCKVVDPFKKDVLRTVIHYRYNRHYICYSTHAIRGAKVQELLRKKDDEGLGTRT
jgi:hypothetical protein